MGPLALLSIGKTLLESGPSIIRGVGNLLGGDAAAGANKAADIIDSVKSLSPKAQEKELVKQLQNLPPEQLVELEEIKSSCEVELSQIEERREANRINAETTRHQSSQETIREEYRQGNDYVKETRPKMARLSAYSTFAYVLVAETARLITDAWADPIVGAQVGVAAILFGPCGTYMGMRTWDGFSKKGKS